MFSSLMTCRKPPRSPTAALLQRGFTMIELLVAVAIVGIVAAIAYPSYLSQVIRGNRTAAQQFLLDVANAEAQYVLDARAYTSTVGTGGLNLSIPASLQSTYAVTVALTAGPPPGYVITATPSGTQTQDGALTLDDLGNKTPTYKW